LYYRGANACILCYDITDAQSFAEMGIWLRELRQNLPSDIVLHVVGTKADMVARDPSRREVPFERCIAYVAENLAPGLGSTPPPTATPLGMPSSAGPQSVEPRSPSSKRSSGFWGQEVGWDACHEISAESGEGVEEVFRVVARKLVDQNRKMQAALLAATSTPGLTPSDAAGGADGGGSYFDGVNPRGSFRVGRDRRSWLFSPGFGPVVSVEQPGATQGDGQSDERIRRRKCC
jgi:GTPase SAR1 family protein